MNVEFQQRLIELENEILDLRRCQARVARAMAALPEGEFTAVHVELLMQLPAGVAAARLADNIRLATVLPRTVDMLEGGEIDLERALAILRATVNCDPEVAAAVEEKVLAKAPMPTATQVGRASHDAVVRADPEGYAQRHQRAVKTRNVASYDGEDGMAVLRVEHASPVVYAMRAKVDALASEIHDPSRSKDEIRADVLADLVLEGPRDSGLRPLIQVTMPLSTLVGYNDDPCELAGYGLIPADVARDLASDPGSVWHRLITDPVSRQLLDYGSTTYRPSASLDRFVRARDKTCRHRGCRRAARRWEG